MNPKSETSAQIQSLLEDSELLSQLQSCVDRASAAEVIVKAAAANGITLANDDVLAHIEALVASQSALSDAELDQVAGGSSGPHPPPPGSAQIDEHLARDPVLVSHLWANRAALYAAQEPYRAARDARILAEMQKQQ